MTIGKLNFHVGRITKIQPFPKARKPAYQLEIDFGSLGTKKSSAQIAFAYPQMESLLGQLCVAVTNFPPRQIANFVSQVLVTGFYADDSKVFLLQPTTKCDPGAEVAVPNSAGSLSSATGDSATIDDFHASPIVIGMFKELVGSDMIFDCGASSLKCPFINSAEIGKRYALLKSSNDAGNLIQTSSGALFSSDNQVPLGTILA